MQISLTGDSAGGHLAVSIISHILHPLANVTPVLPLSSPLASAILISPWISFSTTSKSYSAFEGVDMVSNTYIGSWAESAIGKGIAKQEAAAGRYHAEALRAPPEWWSGLGSVAASLTITAGAVELYVDDIEEFGRAVKEGAMGSARVDVYVEEGGIHDGPVFDVFFQRSSKKLVEFLGEGFK